MSRCEGFALSIAQHSHLDDRGAEKHARAWSEGHEEAQPAHACQVVGTIGGCLFGIVAGSSIAAATLATTAAFALNSARNQLILQGAKAVLT